MPIHLQDLDVIPEVEGLTSALIVPCNLCPGVTVAQRENRPFMQLTKSLRKSPPFDDHLESLRSRLEQAGVKTDVFRSFLYQNWFMCMWTKGRRAKLAQVAEDYDAVVVLGCDSATETVREVVRSIDCKVIEGMQVAGIMNAKLRFRFPDRVTFEDCTVVPNARPEVKEATST